MAVIQTAATLFSGGGLVDCGLKQLGVKIKWAVEKDHKIVDLYRANFQHHPLLPYGVEEVNYSEMPKVDLLHASPSCLSYSQGSCGKNKENQSDIDAAIATARAINELQPNLKFFTLENVGFYLRGNAFEIIRKALEDNSYHVEYKIINFKNYGIPQNRIRLFLIASKGCILDFPQEKQSVSWYDAIADLIPDFERMPLTLTQTQAMDRSGYSHYVVPSLHPLSPILLKRNQIRDHRASVREVNEPSFCITASFTSDGKRRNRRRFANVVTNTGAYSLTVRALARFQTVPDSYQLLEGETAINGRAIGNGVPCKFIYDLLNE